MHKSIYERPNKPTRMVIPQERKAPVLEPFETPKILTVDRATECHVTPGETAQQMAWYLEASEENKILEPSAGTGNLIYALLQEGITANQIVAVERHVALAESLRGRFEDNTGMEIVNRCFLDYAAEQPAAQFDKIIINPPFRKTKLHIEAALKLLRTGGRIVALVPITFEHDAAELLEKLPNDIFTTAKVYTKLIMIGE